VALLVKSNGNCVDEVRVATCKRSWREIGGLAVSYSSWNEEGRWQLVWACL